MTKKIKFSITSLLICMALCSWWIAKVSSSARAQRQSIEWLTDESAIFFYDFEFVQGTFENATHRYQSDPRPTTPSWIIDKLGIDYFHSVVSVKLNNFDGEDLSRLSAFTDLLSLDLQYSHSPNLDVLNKLGRLKWLFLCDSNIDNVALLANNHDLVGIFLDGTQVTDVSPLANLTRIRELGLSELNVKTGLARLGELKGLRYLNLKNSSYNHDEFLKLRSALPDCEIITE
jgi:hypothetical protein